MRNPPNTDNDAVRRAGAEWSDAARLAERSRTDLDAAHSRLAEAKVRLEEDKAVTARLDTASAKAVLREAKAVLQEAKATVARAVLTNTELTATERLLCNEFIRLRKQRGPRMS
jgi:hypothetical protein